MNYVCEECGDPVAYCPKCSLARNERVHHHIRETNRHDGWVTEHYEQINIHSVKKNET
jgi:hypothetical protein